MGDFSDFIPILIAIAIGLYQLFRFLFKGSGPKPPASEKLPPTDTFGGGKPEPLEDWDDIMEALGHKEKPKPAGPLAPPPPPPPRVEPVQPKRPLAPPPVFTRENTPSRPLPSKVEPLPAASFPEPEPTPFFEPKLVELPAASFSTFEEELLIPAKPAPGLTTPVLPGRHFSHYRAFLSDRDRLREAIVLNEILGKPLSLR